MSEKLWYVAHPYSAPTPELEAENVDKCIAICNELLDKGYNLYAPIVMTHWFHVNKERSWKEWMELDKIFMDKCDGLILSGNWRLSKGCLVEKEYFEKQGKPVIIY